MCTDGFANRVNIDTYPVTLDFNPDQKIFTFTRCDASGMQDIKVWKGYIRSTLAIHPIEITAMETSIQSKCLLLKTSDKTTGKEPPFLAMEFHTLKAKRDCLAILQHVNEKLSIFDLDR